MLVRESSGRSREVPSASGCPPGSSLHSLLFFSPDLSPAEGRRYPAFRAGPTLRSGSPQTPRDPSASPCPYSSTPPDGGKSLFPSASDPKSSRTQAGKQESGGNVPLPGAESFGRGGSPGCPGPPRERGPWRAGAPLAPKGALIETAAGSGAPCPPSHRQSRPGSALLPPSPHREEPAGPPSHRRARAPAARRRPRPRPPEFTSRCHAMRRRFPPSLPLGSSARAGEGTAWGQHLLRSLCCVNFPYLRP